MYIFRHLLTNCLLIVGGHSVNVMVNGTLSISIRLQNDDHDHVSVSSTVSPSASTISSTRMPSTVSPTASPRMSPYVPHNTAYTASSWSHQSSATAEGASLYMDERSAAHISSSFG